MQENLLSWLLIHYGQEHMRPGLERIREALKDVFPSLSKTKIVIVAGTNGKGETTLRLSHHLKNHSHYVWTSPHIERITERFRSEKGEIDFHLLQEIIKECHETVMANKYELSFYEFLFFVFCSWAVRNPPEYLLLEVGLGGRLDAVNVFDADLVLLPSISRDHQEILGRRYDEILFEKLGTLRRGKKLIHFLSSEYLIQKTEAFADSVGADVTSFKKVFSIPEYEFSLRNEALASAAFSYLTGKNAQISDIALEHRGEVITSENEFVFFGSHNVDGVRKLIQFLHSGTYTFSRPPFDSVIVAFSRRNLQDLRVMLRMLKKASLGKVVVTIFEHPKAAEKETMEALSQEEGLDFVPDIESFVKKNKDQRMLVTGSYYFLGDFKSLACCK